MFPIIYWAHYKRKIIKGSIRCYICRGKPNILPTTLPRTSRNASTILRLSKCLHHMKHYLINRIDNFIRNSIDIPIYYMGKNHIKPTNLIPYTHKKFGRMTTKFSTGRSQILRAPNYLIN